METKKKKANPIFKNPLIKKNINSFNKDISFMNNLNIN